MNILGKVVLTILMTVALFGSARGQKFIPEIENFSRKKESFLVDQKGDTIGFTLNSLDRRKGLIVRIGGKKVDGSKFDFSAEEVKFLALAPSDFGKFSSAQSTLTNVAKYEKRDAKQLSREYVLLYQEFLPDKNRTVLVQLLNPEFSTKIQVYHDPYAGTTAGIGYGGFTVIGGDDKSYYVKFQGKLVRLKKKDYDEAAKTYYASCPNFSSKFPVLKWSEFEKHAFYLENECK